MAGEWKTAKLGDCFDLIGGYAFKSAEFIESGIPVIKIKNVKANRMLFDDLSYVAPEFLKTRADKVVHKGDLLITMSGNRFDGSPDTWVGKVAQFNEDRPYFLNQRVGILRPKKGAEVDRRFFSFSLSSHFYQTEFIAIATSSGGQANLSPSQILGAPIEYPSLAEQKAIAAVLGALDDKIELNRRMNATLEAMARALFQSWFVDFDPVRAKLDGRPSGNLNRGTSDLFSAEFQDSALGHIPKGWSIGRITDCCERIHSGGTPRRDEPRYWSDATVPWLTSGEVRQPMITATENFISEAGLDESAAKWVPANSTVVALYGATAGQVSFLGMNATTNQAICSLIPKPQFEFFNYFTMRGSIAEMESKAVGSAQQNISKGIIEETTVVLPPIGVLEMFNIVASPLFNAWITNTQQSRTLATMRDTLLPKLLSGEISVK